MSEAAAGVSVIGAVTSTFGTIDAANNEADMMNQKAYLGRMQAKEVLDREQINDQNMLDSTIRTRAEFGSAYAATGFQGGIGSKLEIQRQAEQQIALNDREANFQALMLSKGADMQDLMAGQTRDAGTLKAFGTLLGGAGSAMSSSANRSAGASQEL